MLSVVLLEGWLSLTAGQPMFQHFQSRTCHLSNTTHFEKIDGSSFMIFPGMSSQKKFRWSRPLLVPCDPTARDAPGWGHHLPWMNLLSCPSTSLAFPSWPGWPLTEYRSQWFVSKFQVDSIGHPAQEPNGSFKRSNIQIIRGIATKTFRIPKSQRKAPYIDQFVTCWYHPSKGHSSSPWISPSHQLFAWSHLSHQQRGAGQWNCLQKASTDQDL